MHHQRLADQRDVLDRQRALRDHVAPVLGRRSGEIDRDHAAAGRPDVGADVERVVDGTEIAGAAVPAVHEAQRFGTGNIERQQVNAVATAVLQDVQDEVATIGRHHGERHAGRMIRHRKDVYVLGLRGADAVQPDLRLLLIVPRSRVVLRVARVEEAAGVLEPRRAGEFRALQAVREILAGVRPPHPPARPVRAAHRRGPGDQLSVRADVPARQEGGAVLRQGRRVEQQLPVAVQSRREHQARERRLAVVVLEEVTALVDARHGHALRAP